MDKPDFEKGVSQVAAETAEVFSLAVVLACPLDSQPKLLAPAEAQEDRQSDHLICRLCLSESAGHMSLACSFFRGPLHFTSRMSNVSKSASL